MPSLDRADYVFIALLLFSIAAVSAKPNGAPSSACRDMEPGHTEGQTSSSPFLAKPEKFEILSNGSLEVTLQPADSFTGGFKGFMIMAVDASDVDGFKPIGTFQGINGVAKTLDCAGVSKGALTHTGRDEKTSVSAIWNPPADFDGTVVFKTTFAQTFNTYWIAVKSTPVIVKRSLSYSTIKVNDTTTSWTTTTPSVTRSSPPSLLVYWNDSNSPKYSGCLAITQGPFNRPYQNVNLDARSDCNSHLICRERHPGNSAAFCLRTDANRSCCKSIELRAGKHYESGCFGECSDDDHAYCGRLFPGQNPAECYQGDHPFHRASGSVGCCRAEYERVGIV